MLRALSALFKEYGWRDAPLYAAERVLARATNGRIRLIKYYFVAQPVPSGPLLKKGRGANIEIRDIGPGDPSIAVMPRPADVIGMRFSQGAQCLGAFLDGTLIGFIWLLVGPYQEDEVRARFEPLPVRRAAWDFDVYVDARKRMSFALARLWDGANERLRSSGVEWSISRISAFNRASIAAHSRLGARVLGSAIFIQGGRWQAMASTVAPYLHLSRRPQAFPVIGLTAVSK